jgi:acetyl esterase/lipase
MISIDSNQPTPLDLGQHLSVASARTFFGAVTGVLRLLRGSPPTGWETVRYGLHRDEILDVRAADASSNCHPVVFFHGGGWMMGTKDFYSHDLCFLTAAGFGVYNVEYPKAPEHPHPWILRSVLKSLAFVRKTLGAEFVHVMGDSAGGNLAVMSALLAHNPYLIAPVDADFDAATLPTILSATSIYGVMDRQTCLGTGIPGGHTMLEAYGGSGCLGETVDAAHAITPMDLDFDKHPPCFLGCGDKDIVLPSTQVYEKRLKDNGHDVVVKIYPYATHGYFNFPEGKTKTQSQQDIVAFLRSVEAKQRAS